MLVSLELSVGQRRGKSGHFLGLLVSGLLGVGCVFTDPSMLLRAAQLSNTQNIQSETIEVGNPLGESSPASRNQNYTAQPLPPSLSIPQTIQMPVAPNESSFTRTDGETPVGTEDVIPVSQNNLRGGFGNGSRFEASQNDDSPISSSDQPEYQSRSTFNSRPIDSTISTTNPAIPRLAPNQQQANRNSALTPTINDQMVQPTAFNQAIQAHVIQTAAAKQLISRYSVSSAPDPLPGQPTTLLELINQPVAIHRRHQMVSQYWEVWYDWATLLGHAEYVNWLNTIRNPGSQAEAGLLQAARSSAANQLLAAEIQLGKSQAKLLDFMPQQMAVGNQSIGAVLPLPADQPLIQKYNTNYDLYLSHSMIPQHLRGIDTMLPKTLELICDRAATVQLAKSVVDNAQAGMDANQSNLATVLEAGRVWRTAEQDLIASVTTYNQAIADYALNVTNSAQSPETIVAMLISKPKAVPANVSAHGARQARSDSSAAFGIEPPPNNSHGDINAAPIRSVMDHSSGRNQSPSNGFATNAGNTIRPNVNHNFGGDGNSGFRSPNPTTTTNNQFGSGNVGGTFQPPTHTNPTSAPVRSANANFVQPGSDFER